MKVQDWLGEDNTLGIDIWKNKYQYENESFDDWLDRVSNHNETIKELIVSKKFLFGGRILANRGLQSKGRKITYSNCYVITPPEDNLESIYDTASKLARTYSYGGGCGIDISNLSPRGAKVNNAAKTTSGAVSFMDTYSHVTEQIGQNGRRGALMISLDCHHPDLEEFLDIKNDLNKVTKANISIRITDDFMQAVKNDSDFELSFKRDPTNETVKKTVKARQLFTKLAANNWNTGEPGCLFWDRICDYNLLANTKEFNFAGTNPCAEQPLPAGGSCLLGSINLAEFVGSDLQFQFDEFKRVVKDSVIALNEVLDEGLPLHPLQEQRQSVSDWRQIGLGIMGLADMLIKMQIKYGSERSISLCDKIGQVMAETAIYASAKLAKESKAFPKCNMQDIAGTDFFNRHVKNQVQYNMAMNYGLRNSQLLTVAPTGTLSTMLGISGGIEPVFANYYTRKTESLHGEDTYYKVYTPIVDRYMKANNLSDDSQLPDWFITAQTLNYKDRINMQSIWQSHIDASISSTVNVPNDFTVQDAYNLYMYSYEKGCKGITMFRDGCARMGILTTSSDSAKKEEARGEWHQKPKDTRYEEVKVKIGCGKLILLVGWSDSEQQIEDLFVLKSGTGGCEKLLQSTVISISAILRLGGNIYNIDKAFRGIGTCPSFSSARAKGMDLSVGNSCASSILNQLKKFEKEHKIKIPSEQKKGKKLDLNINKNQENYSNNSSLCPQCGSNLEFSGGCNVCKNCGWSKCS